MAKPKVSGFFTALMIAVISFFVIFFFFPDAANRYLGSAFKKADPKAIEKTVNDTIIETKDKVSQQVSKTVLDLIKK